MTTHTYRRLLTRSFTTSIQALTRDDPDLPHGPIGRGRKRLSQRKENDVLLYKSNCPSPSVLPQATESILHELSYTTVGGLCEAIQELLLVNDSPMSLQSLPHSCWSRMSCNSLVDRTQTPLTPQSTLFNPRHGNNDGYSIDELNYPINSRSSINDAYSAHHLNPVASPLVSCANLTKPGEIGRRLTKLQWIGFLQQQVKRTGPTGRHVVDQLNIHLPEWNSVPTIHDDENHALKLDQGTFSELVGDAVAHAASVIEGRNWSEDLALLARTLYPGKTFIE